MLSCARVESWIRFTQVGDPLAAGPEGIAHCARANRLVILSILAVLDAEDEEAADLVFRTRDITEGDVVPVGLAVLRPLSHDLGIGLSSLAGGGLCGESERNAEIIGEEISGGTGRRRQPFACG